MLGRHRRTAGEIERQSRPVYSGAVHGSEREGGTCIERGDETSQGQVRGGASFFCFFFADNPITPPPLTPNRTPTPRLEDDEPLLLLIVLIRSGLI